MFVTIPRFVDGIPQTLGVVSSEYGTNGPKLMGYPNYEWQSSRKGANCDGFTSVFRVAVININYLKHQDQTKKAYKFKF